MSICTRQVVSSRRLLSSLHKYRLPTFDECNIENTYYYEYKRFDYYRIICTYYNTGGEAKLKRKREEEGGLGDTGQ